MEYIQTNTKKYEQMPINTKHPLIVMFRKRYINTLGSRWMPID